MINVGKYNLLEVCQKTDKGYHLTDEEKTSELFLHNKELAEGETLNEGDKVNVFVYMDYDKMVPTLKKAYAEVSNIAYLEVVDNTKIGSFVDLGINKDVLVPLRERTYPLEKGKKYLFYVYLDKTNRIAATTKIEGALETTDEYKVGDEVKGVVYGFQTNRSVMVAVDNKYKGVILNNEYFTEVQIGDELNLRVKRFYEDNKLGLTPRKAAKAEREELQDVILKYLNEHDGFMPYNDKSSPEDIRRVFGESKNYFKNSLGGLMKKGLISQNEEGTKLIKK